MFRPHRLGLALFFACVFAGGSVGRAQVDAGLEIRGVVRAPGSRAPMAGIPVELHRTGGPERALQAMITDAQGRFGFRGLGLGRYFLNWMYPERVGSSWKGTEGVVLSEAGLLEEVELWLAPLGRVSGRVLDPDGAPVVGACVDLSEAFSYRGESALSRVSVLFSETCETDAAGAYSLMVPSGAYYLRVRADDSDLPSPQFYPGVVDPRQAPRITVGGGMDLQGIDLRLIRSPRFRVLFRLPPPGEHPGIPLPDPDSPEDADARVEVLLRPVGRDGPDTLMTGMGLEVSEDGQYRTTALLPGEYVLTIRYVAVNEARLHEGRFVVMNPVDRFRVVLTDEDVDLGMVSASPKASVSGRLVFRSTRGARPEPEWVSTVALVEIGRGMFGGLSEVAPDGAFAIDGLSPGVYEFLPPARDLPEPWYVARVASGARDVLNHGLEVGGGSLNPIEVVVADDSARVSGVVRSGDGTLVPGARIVLIPPTARRGLLSVFPTILADGRGAFTLPVVPPGEYRILAIDEAGVGAQLPIALPYWQAADFLRRHEFEGELTRIDPAADIVNDVEPITLSD